MIALLTACLFFEILVHVLNCISKSTCENCEILKFNCSVTGSLSCDRFIWNIKHLGVPRCTIGDNGSLNI